MTYDWHISLYHSISILSMEYWCWWNHPNLSVFSGKSPCLRLKSFVNVPFSAAPLNYQRAWGYKNPNVSYKNNPNHAVPNDAKKSISCSQRSLESPAGASPRQQRNRTRFLPKRRFWWPRSDLSHLREYRSEWVPDVLYNHELAGDVSPPSTTKKIL